MYLRFKRKLYFFRTMTKTSLVIFMTAIMVVGVLGTSLTPNAEALKGKGVGISQYGSSTDVCGLVLCSEYPGGKTAYQETWNLSFIDKSTVANISQQDKHETKQVSVSAHNVDEEYPAQLDVFIHKFELDKISAEEALDGIKEVHDAYVNERITSDIVNGVGDKLILYHEGTFDAATAVEAIHLTAEPQNVNPEYQAALDEVIHKFELDKISAEEAIMGIKEVHDGFVGLYITSDLIEAVEEKIALIDSGNLSGGEAVEAIHLTAEPQNVNPEYQAALDEVIHKFELDKISAEEAIMGIKEVHDGFVGLYITSDLIEAVEEKIALIDSGNLSGGEAVEAIHLTAEPQNVNPEYQAALDEVIHKFELDKISAEEAIMGIKEVHDGFVGLYITSDLIEAVEEKIALIDSGNLSGGEAVEAIHLTAEPQNVDPEFASALDEVIHEFELDKISAEEAMDEIIEVYDGMVELTITSDIVDGVGEKIALYNSGDLEDAQAVEAVHLTAEPQNVDPELIRAIEEYTYQYELNEISLPELIEGVTEVYDGMVELTITSDLIEDIGVQLVVYDSGRVSPEFTAEEIDEIIEKAELAAAKASMSEDTIPVMKELPPNTVDIPAGTAVPGCEIDDWCYMSSKLTVDVGTTITWINSDTLPHTVTSGSDDADAVGLDVPNGFDSGFMSGGDEYEQVFDVAGFYDYYCQLHPWMMGSVTVE